MYVLDTNILILYFQDESVIADQLEAWERENVPLIISTAVEAEILSWPKLTGEDIKTIDRTLKTMTILPIDSGIARMAAFFRRQYNIELIDAMIAATAFLNEIPLVTRNAKDFSKIREIEILKI